MSEESLNKAPKWFYIVAIAALIWNIMGVAAYVMQVTMTPEDLAALPEAQRTLYETTPAWATAAFALAVNGGAFGCFLLLLKKNAAFYLLAISLVGVVVQLFHAFFISNSFEVFGPGGMIMPIMVLAIAIYLVFLAKSARANGWTS